MRKRRKGIETNIWGHTCTNYTNAQLFVYVGKWTSWTTSQRTDALTCLIVNCHWPIWLPSSIFFIPTIYKMVCHDLKDSLWLGTSRKRSKPLGNKISSVGLANSHRQNNEALTKEETIFPTPPKPAGIEEGSGDQKIIQLGWSVCRLFHLNIVFTYVYKCLL